MRRTRITGGLLTRPKQLTFARRLRYETLEPRLALTSLLAGYQETLIAGGISASALSQAPDGRLFVADKGGSVWIIENDVKLETPFFSVAVDTYSDRGLVSVLVDPQFEQNHFVYVLYTAAVAVNPDQPNNGAITRLVRLTADHNNHDVAEPGSAVVLVDGIPSPIGFHVGGFLRFGADNYLYVGVGDGSSNNLAQDPSSVLGKILRIDARNPSQLIPADNPFVNTPGARGEVWAVGFRNPFSGDVDPTTGRIFINDVGQDLWEEVDILTKGGNYGWPNVEGPTNDARYVNPFYSYAHFGNGAAATGAAFYSGEAFPENQHGKFFAGDVAQNVIRSIDPLTAEAEIFATDVPFPTGLAVGTDGALYYSSISSGIFKISYTGSNTTQPTAIATSDVTDGLRPVTVNFDGALSTNPSGAPLLYQWDFGDGTTSVSPNPQHIYTANGKYNAVLTVTDSSPGGLSSTAVPIRITVGNRAPIPTITTPAGSDTYQAGQTITFSGTATDPDSGTLPASAYEWSFLFGHNVHFHSFIAPINGVTSGSFTIPLTGETAPDQYYRIILTVTDPQGLSKQIYRDIRAQTANITLGTNVPGLSLNLDSHPLSAPSTVTGVVGMTRTLDAPYMQVVNGSTYYFTSWSDGGSETHDITIPAADQSYTANYHLASSSRVADISFSPPVNWQPNVAQTFNVTVTNNGTSTWFANGTNSTRLGVYFGGTSDAKFAWSQEPLRFTLPANVAPGGAATLSVTVSPGTTLGKIVLRARLVTEGVDWFDQVASATIYSGSLLAGYAQGPPDAWAQGGSPRFTVTVTNTGNMTWPASGANSVKLGAYFDAPSDQIGAWTSEPTRFLLPYNVAPGQSTNIIVSLPAPATLGNHVLRYRLVQEGVAWAQQVVTNTIFVGSLAAQIVGQAPAVFGSGQSQSYTLAITNTGTMPWSSDRYLVSVTTDWDAPNDQLFSWTTEPVRTYLPAVLPGQTVNVTVGVTAPTAPGAHVLRTRMVMDGQGWFSVLQKQVITVGTLSASYSSAPPTVWELGSTKTFSLTVTNTGNVTWSAGGTAPVQLGVYFDATSDAPFAWTAPPVQFSLSADVAPGQSQTISVTVTAPNLVGNYVLRARLVQVGIAWFDSLFKNPITQPTLAVLYAAGPPTSWYGGLPQPYSITVTNVGTQTWNATGANPVRLGVYFNGTSDAVGAWASEPQRFNLPVDVAPGQSATFPVSPTPPTASGAFVLRQRLVKEGVSWFSAVQNTSVTVATLAATYSATPPTTWTPGVPQTVSVSLTNIGSTTWNNTGANPVRLAGYFGGANDSLGAWTTEPARSSLPSSIAPGVTATVNITVTPPSAPGTYVLRLRMVKEGIGYFTTMRKSSVTVGTAAALTPPTVYQLSSTGNPPPSVTTNVPLAFSLGLTNLGPDAWNSTGTSRVKALVYFTLASAAAPTLNTTPAYSTYLPSNVAKGSVITLPVSFTAPTTAGAYVLRVRLLSDDGSVSDFTLNANVQATLPGLNFASGFAGAASQLSFNGVAAKIVGGQLQLTDGGTNQASSVYGAQKLDVSRFTTQFSFQLLNPNADGFTFILQGSSPTALGPTGGALGYSSGSATTGIAKSVAIKFDLYSNQGESNNSTGLYLNAAAPFTTGSINLTSAGLDLHSGHVTTAAMSYDGTVLTVTLTDNTTNVSATQSYTVNIPSIVGSSTAYIGFTAGTGGATAKQNILNWTYTPTTGLQLVAAVNSTTATAAPLLTAPALGPIVQEAILRWQAAGIGANATALLKTINFQIKNLDSQGAVGLATPGLVQIDDDGARYGWFVDPTPKTDVEFATKVTATELKAVSGSAAYGRMDLLTVVMHELGHELGLADLSPTAAPHSLMTASTTTGLRRLPPVMTPALVTPMKAGTLQALQATSSSAFDALFALLGTLPWADATFQALHAATDRTAPLPSTTTLRTEASPPAWQLALLRKLSSGSARKIAPTVGGD